MRENGNIGKEIIMNHRENIETIILNYNTGGDLHFTLIFNKSEIDIVTTCTIPAPDTDEARTVIINLKD